MPHFSRDLNEKLSMEVSTPELISDCAIKFNEDSTETNSFQYAFALAHSSSSTERTYGISLFQQLISSNYLYSSDCIYGQSIAYYLNGDTASSRKCSELLLRSNPNDPKAQEVHNATREIMEKTEKDVNLAIGGGVLVASLGLVVGIAGLFLGKKR